MPKISRRRRASPGAAPPVTWPHRLGTSLPGGEEASAGTPGGSVGWGRPSAGVTAPSRSSAPRVPRCSSVRWSRDLPCVSSQLRGRGQCQVASLALQTAPGTQQELREPQRGFAAASGPLGASWSAGLVPAVPGSVLTWPARAGGERGTLVLLGSGGGRCGWPSAAGWASGDVKPRGSCGPQGSLKMKRSSSVPLFGENVKCQVGDNEQWQRGRKPRVNLARDLLHVCCARLCIPRAAPGWLLLARGRPSLCQGTRRGWGRCCAAVSVGVSCCWSSARCQREAACPLILLSFLQAAGMDRDRFCSASPRRTGRTTPFLKASSW